MSQQKQTTKIAITGAAGQISYSLLFRIACGSLLGDSRPIELSLLEVPQALGALEGVAMELDDAAFPLLDKVNISDSPDIAFADADIVFLVGARPRSAGMERKDLLSANAEIFSVQGKALDNVVNKDAKILVVGNPANTNCLIAQRNAPALEPSQFSAMTRLDHNRALAQLSSKAGVAISEVKKIAIWGNHSSTQYPDIYHATISGKPALSCVDEQWYQEEMIPLVQQRGAAIIKARGSSSAASAASAAIDHMKDWLFGSSIDSWVSMGIVSTGEYGIEEGLVYSYPVCCVNGIFEVVAGLEQNEFSQLRMKETEAELKSERDAVHALLLSS